MQMQEWQKAQKNNFELDVVSVRLVKDAPMFSEHSFNTPQEVMAVLGDYMCELDREVVCVVNLRSDLHPINVHFASMGALNEAMAHPRELLKASILSNAASIMLVHCHPSGNLIPSKADTMMTDRMNTICEMMGMPLVDHVIVGGDNREYFSFKEKGMLDIPTISLAQDYKTFDMRSPLVAEKGKTR
jgi:DNA repair protein RadC